MPKVSLSISVDDEYLDRFPEVVERIKKAGMKVEQQMEKIGVITGSIDSTKAKSLQKIKGVANVEQPRQFQIAPPDSDVQ
jgi:hypothetical protein